MTAPSRRGLGACCDRFARSTCKFTLDAGDCEVEQPLSQRIHGNVEIAADHIDAGPHGQQVQHQDEDGHGILLQAVVVGERLAFEERHDDRRAVERRDRNEVKERKRQVDHDKGGAKVHDLGGNGKGHACVEVAIRCVHEGGREARERDVRRGACRAHQDLVPLGVLEVVEVDGHGLGKGEHRAAGGEHEQWQEDGAKRVDVVERVERNAAARTSSLIAERPGRGGMRALVDDDTNDDGDGAREQVHEAAAGHGAPLADAARGTREQVIGHKQDDGHDGVIQAEHTAKGRRDDAVAGDGARQRARKLNDKANDLQLGSEAAKAQQHGHRAHKNAADATNDGNDAHRHSGGLTRVHARSPLRSGWKAPAIRPRAWAALA